MKETLGEGSGPGCIQKRGWPEGGESAKEMETTQGTS